MPYWKGGPHRDLQADQRVQLHTAGVLQAEVALSAARAAALAHAAASLRAEALASGAAPGDARDEAARWAEAEAAAAAAAVPRIVPSTQYYVLHGTQEVFLDVAAYTARRLWYQERQWACEATGTHGLTFQEAQMSEFHALQMLWAFPRPHIACALRILNETVGLSAAETLAVIAAHFERCFLPDDVVFVRGAPSSADAGDPLAAPLDAAARGNAIGSTLWRLVSLDSRAGVAALEPWDSLGAGAGAGAGIAEAAGGAGVGAGAVVGAGTGVGVQIEPVAVPLARLVPSSVPSAKAIRGFVRVVADRVGQRWVLRPFFSRPFGIEPLSDAAALMSPSAPPAVVADAATELAVAAAGGRRARARAGGVAAAGRFGRPGAGRVDDAELSDAPPLTLQPWAATGLAAEPFYADLLMVWTFLRQHWGDLSCPELSLAQFEAMVQSTASGSGLVDIAVRLLRVLVSSRPASGVSSRKRRTSAIYQPPAQVSLKNYGNVLIKFLRAAGAQRIINLKLLERVGLTHMDARAKVHVLAFLVHKACDRSSVRSAVVERRSAELPIVRALLLRIAAALVDRSAEGFLRSLPADAAGVELPPLYLLGCDRWRNRYWYFEGAGDHILVERARPSSGSRRDRSLNISVLAVSQSSESSTTSDDEQQNGTEICDDSSGSDGESSGSDDSDEEDPSEDGGRGRGRRGAVAGSDEDDDGTSWQPSSESEDMSAPVPQELPGEKWRWAVLRNLADVRAVTAMLDPRGEREYALLAALSCLAPHVVSAEGESTARGPQDPAPSKRARSEPPVAAPAASKRPAPKKRADAPPAAAPTKPAPKPPKPVAKAAPKRGANPRLQAAEAQPRSVVPVMKIGSESSESVVIESDEDEEDEVAVDESSGDADKADAAGDDGGGYDDVGDGGDGDGDEDGESDDSPSSTPPPARGRSSRRGQPSAAPAPAPERRSTRLRMAAEWRRR